MCRNTHGKWKRAVVERSGWLRGTVQRKEKAGPVIKNTSLLDKKGGADDLLVSPWKPNEHRVGEETHLVTYTTEVYLPPSIILLSIPSPPFSVF